MAREDVLAIIDEAVAPWLAPIRELLGDAVLYDAHTHIGANDPDGFRQTPSELLRALDPIGARAVTFAMHEPDGYPSANDAVLAAVAEAPDRLAGFARVDPRADAAAEAVRCLDLGASGVKLHPRAEGFALSEPGVEEIFRIADERRVPILIHAGRGIPALGEDSVTLAGRYPGARVILAHAAVSDLAWIWKLMPEHPNLFVDTSWWDPADMMAMFELIPSGQILWASDSPYGLPSNSAMTHLRFAIQAGIEGDALRSIAGGQIGRLLDGAELEHHGRPPGESRRPSPALERVVSHLVAAIGVVVSEQRPTEMVALARLSADVPPDDPDRELLDGIVELLDRWEEAEALDPNDVRFPPSAALIVAALSIARTPAAPPPASPRTR